MSPKPLLLTAFLLLGATTAPVPTLYPAFHFPTGDYLLVHQLIRETTSQDGSTHRVASWITYFDLQVDRPTADSRLAHLTFRRMRTSITDTRNNKPIAHTESDTSSVDPAAAEPPGKILLGLPFAFYLTTAGVFEGAPGLDAFKKNLLKTNPQLSSAAIDELTNEVYNPQSMFTLIRGMLPMDSATLGSIWKNSAVSSGSLLGGPMDVRFTSHFNELIPAPDGTPIALIDYTAAGQMPLSPESAASLRITGGTVSQKITGTDERNLRTTLVTKSIRETQITVDLVNAAGNKLHDATTFKTNLVLTPKQP